MGIHAKSLNQLAHELEMRNHPTEEAPQPQPTPAPPSDLAKSLEEFKNFCADLFGERAEARVEKAEAHQATAVECEEVPAPAPAFYMDSTLGTRTRTSQISDVHKRESALRLYSGFASRDDIAGQG